MNDHVGLTSDPLEHDPAAGTVTAGRTERQQAIAALIHQAVIENGIDYAGGDSDVVAVHAGTIGALQTRVPGRRHGLYLADFHVSVWLGWM